MRIREIPRAEWYKFFREFSRRQEDRPVTVWAIDRAGAKLEARELALEGIVADPEATAISIHLGRGPQRHVEHPLEKPFQVWLQVDEAGRDRVLEIDSESGARTVLEFLSPVPAGNGGEAKSES
jgi:hypothetical protein